MRAVPDIGSQQYRDAAGLGTAELNRLTTTTLDHYRGGSADSSMDARRIDLSNTATHSSRMEDIPKLVQDCLDALRSLNTNMGIVN